MGVLALCRTKSPFLFFHFLCSSSGPAKSFVLWCQLHLCSIGFQNLDLFRTRSFLHADCGMVVFDSGYKCDSDSRISACSFNNPSTRLQLSFFLCRLNHIERRPVFYASTRIESFYFCINIGFQSLFLFHFMKMKNGCIADKLYHIVIYLSHTTDPLTTDYLYCTVLKVMHRMHCPDFPGQAL